MIVGVGSRLIPMFLISKYCDDRKLWLIFGLLNTALILFLLLFLADCPTLSFYIPIFLGAIAIILFGKYCYDAYQVRLRNRVDEQLKLSLISVIQMLFPLLILIVTLVLLPRVRVPNMSMIYGFSIFFGWITAIILGMTFKTMPFIVWNKVYHTQDHKGKTPAPKELFDNRIYKLMMYSYLIGFLLFVIGIMFSYQNVLELGAVALLLAAILYVYNVLITAGHKSKRT
jgi:hypothetical protein